MTVLVIVPDMPSRELERRLTSESCEGDDGTTLELLSPDPSGRDPIFAAYGATFNHVSDVQFMDWLSALPWTYDGGWPCRHQVLVVTHHEYSDIAPLVHRLTKDGWETL